MPSKTATRQETARAAGRRPHVQQVTIRGELASTVTPEGQQLVMPVKDLVQLIKTHGGRSLETGCLLPDGVKLIRSRGPVTVWVYQRPPQVHNLRWIAGDSPAPFGKGTKYRTVRVALPYLVVLAVFTAGRGGRLQLSPYNECFFRNGPLKSADDELFYPALLNCSRFDPPQGHPLAWICTANLDLGRVNLVADDNRRLRDSLRALLHCLLETGYNHSSEHHEASSWYTESAGIDPRISTIEAWEAATAADSLFVLDLPWLKTGMSLRQVIDRILGHAGNSGSALGSAADLMRIMANNSGRRGRKEKTKKELWGAIIDELF